APWKMPLTVPPRRLGRHLPRRLISALVSKYQGAYKVPWKIPFTVPNRRLGRPSTTPYKRLRSQDLLRYLQPRRFCGRREKLFLL
ncbi:hypothetical protein PanWU01x14_139250, partial [Parasponia andersonii]